MKRNLIGGYRLIGISVGAVVLSTLLSLSGCGSKTSTPTNATQANQTVAAKAGSVSVVVEAPAVVEPYISQTVRAATEGVVTSAVREGETVQKGDVIVTLDQADQLVSVRQAELALAQARLNRQKAVDDVSAAEKDLKDKETLIKTGAIPQDQVRAASDAASASRRSLDSADIAVSQSQLSLEGAKANLSATEVRAPFSGVVIGSKLNPGDLVNKGSELVVMADIARLRLSAEVDEYDIGKVKAGQSVTVTSDTLGKESLRTSVERVSKAAEIINNIPIFKVYAVLANPDERLKPGMSTDISILIRSDKGLVIPASAVSSVRGRSYVKVDNNGEIETKRVEIGADDGVNVVILDGLTEGDLVVLPASAGVNLGVTQSTSGTSIVPISIPGSGGTK
jgi:RND family efflux transporter MFP subunit